MHFSPTLKSCALVIGPPFLSDRLRRSTSWSSPPTTFLLIRTITLIGFTLIIIILKFQECVFFFQWQDLPQYSGFMSPIQLFFRLSVDNNYYTFPLTVVSRPIVGITKTDTNTVIREVSNRAVFNSSLSTISIVGLRLSISDPSYPGPLSRISFKRSRPLSSAAPAKF